MVPLNQSRDEITEVISTSSSCESNELKKTKKTVLKPTRPELGTNDN